MAARDAKAEADGGRRGPHAAPATPTRAATDDVPEPSAEEARAALPAPDLRDPVVFAERQLLQTLAAVPRQLRRRRRRRARARRLHRPGPPRRLRRGARSRRPAARARPPRPGPTAVIQAAPLAVRGLVAELAVAPLPTRFDKATGLPERRYIDALVTRVQEVSLTRRIADAMSAMRRMATDPHADPGAGAHAERRAAGAPARARDAARPGLADGARRCGAPSACPPTVARRRRARRRASAVLSWGARRPRGATVVATNHAPVCRRRGRSARTLARPWHEVDAGTWSAELHHPHRHLGRRRRARRSGSSARPSLVPETLRERVQASVVLAQRSSSDRAGPPGWSMRQDLATGELVEQVVLGRGVRADDPEVAARTDAALAYLREQVGSTERRRGPAVFRTARILCYGCAAPNAGDPPTAFPL